MRFSNRDHDPAGSAAARRRRPARLLVAISVALCLSVLEFGAALSLGAGPPPQDLEVQVTECPSGDQSGCEQSTQTVTQQQKAPAQHTTELTPVPQQPAKSSKE